MVLAAMGLASVGVVAAHAQDGGSMVVMASPTQVGMGGGRALSRESVEQMGRALGLDDVQSEVALELFKDVVDKRQALGDAQRERVRQARERAEGGDVSKLFSEIKLANAEHQSAVDELEATFMQDLSVMLTPEQQESWPAAERIYRRGRALGSLYRSEARVDVDALVRDEFARAYERADVAEVLERWSVRVDGLLVERERAIEKITGDSDFQGGVIIGGGRDPFKPLREIDGRIAAAGAQAVRMLSGVLESDDIEQAWVRRAFARVYRPTDGERRLAAALQLEGLTSDQREELDALAGRHERDAAVARDRWVDAERDREADDAMPPGMVLAIEGGEPSATALARQAVDELDERLEEHLRTILNEGQLAALPAAAPEAEERPITPASGSRTIRIGG